MYFLKKKHVKISQVIIKLVITIEKNWMKAEHVQLFYNEMDEMKIVKFFKIHYPIKYKIPFLHFHLIESI